MEAKIKVTFSKNCIGGDRCCCKRCLTEKGEQWNVLTEKRAEIQKVFQKVNLTLSMLSIAKTDEERKQWINSAIKELVREAGYVELL